MKKVYVLLCAIGIVFSFCQCSSSKYQLEKESLLSPYKPYFQSWIAEVEKGGSGFNITFPNLNANDAVVLDSVFFRGLKGKLVKGRAKYIAQLQNPSPYDRDMSPEAAFIKDNEPKFPFKLLNTECVISYFENGLLKYHKVSGLTEKEGVFYDNDTLR